MQNQEYQKRTANEIVKSFYDEFGWQNDGEVSGEDKLFRTFPKAYQLYTLESTKRTLATFDGRLGVLLIVGCGDMPASHIHLANQFEKVICVDISKLALKISEEKIGGRGTYVLESIVETDLSNAVADCVYCAHVLYHIDQNHQEKAVRQMLRLTKPGGRVVIVYANPRTLFTIPGELMRWWKKLRGKESSQVQSPELYYHAHRLGWWQRFKDSGRISFAPWEIIGSRPARAILKTEGIASAFYQAASAIEYRWPAIAAKAWQYPIVIIDKIHDR